MYTLLKGLVMSGRVCYRTLTVRSDQRSWSQGAAHPKGALKDEGGVPPWWGEMVTALSRKQFSAWGQICPQPTHSVGRRGHTPAWFRPGRCGEGRHLPTGVKHKSEALCEGTAQYTVCLLPVKQESSRRDGREG